MCTTHHTTPSNIQPPSPADLEPIIVIIISHHHFTGYAMPPRTVPVQHSVPSFPPDPSVHTYTGDRSRVFFHLRPSPSNNGKTFSSLDEKGYVPKQRGRAAGWGLHTHPRGLQGLLLRACVIDRPLFHPIDCCAWGGTTLTFHFFACDGCEVVRL